MQLKKLYFSAVIIFVVASLNAEIREPAVAGQFYPNNPKELAYAIDSSLQYVPEQKIKGKPVALIVPHAGYVYSGQTAAYAFKLLKDIDVDTVILIGNSHRYYLKKAAVYSEGEFKTPLGNLKINESLAKKIINNTKIAQKNTRAHYDEHSLEVELPFIIKTLGEVKIVPILLSNMKLDDCSKIARSILKSIKELKLQKKVIIIASSDMSHYPSYNNANLIDNSILKSIEKFDVKALKKTVSSFEKGSVKNLSCTLCAEESVYVTMDIAKGLGATKSQILHYSNSASASGDKSRVVGYGAVAFVNTNIKTSGSKAKPRPAHHGQGDSKMTEFTISQDGQKQLLKIARESIEEFLKTKKIKEFKVTSKELLTPSAVFVTLTKNHRLRGCIGTTVPQMPLYQAVNQMAISAAFEDYRFSKVTEQELKDIKIEISVLSPLTKVDNADEIIPKKHGVVAKKGFRSGLFLPQVWDHFNNKEDFLGELCRQKAGLSSTAWKDGSIDLYIFSVFAFEEK